ncbi:hypothetical protein GLOIN_2v1735201 [Rhizophagus clarus]|uniref:SAM domain-containing protein n=1 Tax=Rhizophagus clarus TaxID=94130 RepID=A0A8H3QPG0_9GLOM|nr:hypothetical protein GLOIN_2v1735201 [Rhizophagus clarus]GES84146.1 hypothetical protein GLOIN_2v1735201 [Rhizophagus clarus]
MQYSSSISRNLMFIIFTIFLFNLRAQSYYTGILSNQNNCVDCDGQFHVYVTDCNGSVLRDAGIKDCGDVFHGSDVWFYWEQAPDLYCVHVYPQTHPPRNRYQQFYKTDSCMILGGNEENWHFDQTDMDNCRKGGCPNGIDKDEIKVDENADEVDKFRYGTLIQDKDPLVDYCLKLVCSEARYKACSGMWKFRQLSAKIIPVKITQIRKARCLPLPTDFRQRFFYFLNKKILFPTPSEEVDGPAFLKLTEEKLRSIGFALGPAIKLAEEIKALNEKPKRAFSSYRSLSETIIKFSSVAWKKFWASISLWTKQTRILACDPVRIVGEESTGRVDYAINKVLSLIFSATLSSIICFKSSIFSDSSSVILVTKSGNFCG